MYTYGNTTWLTCTIFIIYIFLITAICPAPCPACDCCAGRASSRSLPHPRSSCRDTASPQSGPKRHGEEGRQPHNTPGTGKYRYFYVHRRYKDTIWTNFTIGALQIPHAYLHTKHMLMSVMGNKNVFQVITTIICVWRGRNFAHACS